MGFDQQLNAPPKHAMRNNNNERPKIWDSPKQVIKWLVLVGISLMIYFWLVNNVWEKGDLGAALAKANWAYMFVAVFLASFIPLICSGRWFMLLIAMGKELKFSKALMAVSAGYPINLVTPSKAGDLTRAWALRKEIPWAESLGSISVERLIDLAVLTIIGTIGAWIHGLTTQAYIAGTLFLGIIGALITLSFINIDNFTFIPEKIRNKVSDMLKTIKIIYRRPRYMFYSMLFSLLQWSLVIIGCSVVLAGLGHSVSPFLMAGTVPLAIFIGLIPVTFGGMGTRDAALIYLLDQIVPADIVLILGISYALLYYLWIAILGFVPFVYYLLKKD